MFSEYSIKDTYKGGTFKEDVLNGATLIIEGAEFNIERVYTLTGKPTPIFEFTSYSEINQFTDELIELGWDESAYKVDQLVQKLGLRYSTKVLKDGKPGCVEVIP